MCLEMMHSATKEALKGRDKDSACQGGNGGGEEEVSKIVEQWRSGVSSNKARFDSLREEWPLKRV